MIPIRLQVYDFMNHRESDIDFSIFDSALIVARDINNHKKSNGIGKTTIYSAIIYALFGEVPTSSVEKVIRDGAKKCVVIFDFELSGSTYRIERGRTKKNPNLKFSQFVDGEWRSISGTRIPEIDSKIHEIIKFSYKAFTCSIIFAQKDLHDIVNADKPDKRLKLLSEPLNLKDYIMLEKAASEEAKPIKKDIESTQSAIAVLGDPDAEIQAAQTEINFCNSAFSDKTSSIEKVTDSLNSHKNSVAELKKALNSNDMEIHDKLTSLSEKRKEIKRDLERANNFVQENEKKIDENNKRCIELTAKLNKLIDKQSGLKQQDVKSSDDILKALKKVSEDEMFGITSLTKTSTEYDEANKRIPNGDFCAQCFQPITEEHRNKCAEETNKILEEKSKQITTLKANLTKCRTKKVSLEKDYQISLKHFQELEMVEQNIKNVRSELEMMQKHISSAEETMKSNVNKTQNLQTELANINSQINQLQSLVTTSESKDEVSKKIFSLNNEIVICEKALEKLREDINNIHLRQGAAQEKLKIAKDNKLKIKDKNEELTKLHKQLNIIQLVINAFGTQGIPKFIINSMIDEYQAETNAWLQKLRPELEIQFSKDMELTYRVNGREREYKQLSPGQLVYITLSLKLGTSRAMQKKFGMDIRFLLLDEVDQSLDDEGVEAFIDVIRILKEEFKILVITHNSDLKDKFTHTILVEGDDNKGATSSVVTAW